MLNDWVDRQQKEVANRDKAIALAMLRLQLHQPMCMLTPPPKEPVPPIRVPYDSDDEEGDWRVGPYGGQVSWKERVKRNKAKNLEREDMRGSESAELRAMELHEDMSLLDLGVLGSVSNYTGAGASPCKARFQ